MSEDSECIVEIPQGKLRGRKERSLFGEDFFSFTGIPYARPPVGDLRFTAPQPADGWTGIRDAAEDGKVCPSTEWDKTTYVRDGNEDSLHLNVFCRQMPKGPDGKRFPVMVFIHGGGFEFGTGNKKKIGPDYFMLYDVLLVTFNYRLGALGFLSLQTVECPGNFGLKDQQLALRWVKSNIDHFGGDPNNVTIFGISAGGASVQYQTLALSNEGLFRRAIAQSGSALNGWAYANNPRESAFLLGKRLGCDTKDDKILLDFLRKASAEDIAVKAQGIIREIEGPIPGDSLLGFTFVPTAEPEHEGAFITRHPWVLLKEGKHLDVPLITGIAEKEMILGVKGPNDYPRFSGPEEFQRLVPKEIGDRNLAVAERLKNVYFKNGVDLDGYIDVLSDTAFNYGVYKTVMCRTENAAIRSPTYLYIYSYEGDQPFIKEMFGVTGIKGTAHGEDTPYLFRLETTNPEAMKPGARDHRMMRNFTRLWVSFAAGGTPAVEEPPFTWKKVSGSGNLEYLALGERLEMKAGFIPERMVLWDEIYSGYFDR